MSSQSVSRIYYGKCAACNGGRTAVFKAAPKGINIPDYARKIDLTYHSDINCKICPSCQRQMLRKYKKVNDQDIVDNPVPPVQRSFSAPISSSTTVNSVLTDITNFQDHQSRNSTKKRPYNSSEEKCNTFNPPVPRKRNDVCSPRTLKNRAACVDEFRERVCFGSSSQNLDDVYEVENRKKCRLLMFEQDMKQHPEEFQQLFEKSGFLQRLSPADSLAFKISNLLTYSQLQKMKTWDFLFCE